jgi:hypothetical protein
MHERVVRDRRGLRRKSCSRVGRRPSHAMRRTVGSRSWGFRMRSVRTAVCRP